MRYCFNISTISANRGQGSFKKTDYLTPDF